MKTMNTKIQLTDSTQDALLKMSEGNPGALTVCVQILKNGEQIDPDNAMGGLGVILFLDTLGLYGPKIWMLFADVCEHNLSKMLAVLRAAQLGLITDKQLGQAVENYGEGLDIPTICTQVTQRLPRFRLNTTKDIQ